MSSRFHARPFQALLACLLLGCSPADETRPSLSFDGQPFDVLILALDACRADRIGGYGYERPTTPNLDALISDPDAVLYEQYFVEGNWTKPSTASLFTGLYVQQHGVVSGHVLKDGHTYTTQILSDDHSTLAETMGELGFSTFAVAKSRHLVPAYGFAQGFDHYMGRDDLSKDELRVAETARLIHEIDQPFFGYVHLNACHHPFREKERHAGYMNQYGGGYPEAERIAAGIDFTKPDLKFSIPRGEVELEPADQAHLSVVYDAQLRRVDEEMVAPILAALRRSGRFDRTLLIVTADHGEELNEHGGYAHGHALWNEIIHVPLIVKFPAGTRPVGLSDRVAAAGTNVDLYPSILRFLDHPVPDALPGRSLFENPEPGFAFSQSDGDWAVIQDKDKLYVAAGEQSLFDLAADPRERTDVASEHPERVAELVELGQRVLALEGPAGSTAVEIDTTLSEEARENLRALGYLE
jgi:arylsulfatase A-like enzyme